VGTASRALCANHFWS